MRLTFLVAVLVAAVLAAYRPAPEPPRPLVPADSTAWQNLQVLPDTISHERLDAIMDGFTDALGIRCSFCHVRQNDAWDFASDAKGHKTIARGMMRMTWELNRVALPAIDGLGAHGPAEVTCWTCHRGEARPAADTTGGRAAPAPHSH